VASARRLAHGREERDDFTDFGAAFEAAYEGAAGGA